MLGHSACLFFCRSQPDSGLEGRDPTKVMDFFGMLGYNRIMEEDKRCAHTEGLRTMKCFLAGWMNRQARRSAAAARGISAPSRPGGNTEGRTCPLPFDRCSGTKNSPQVLGRKLDIRAAASKCFSAPGCRFDQQLMISLNESAFRQTRSLFFYHIFQNRKSISW